jgi:hypothetical protein
MSLSVSDTDFAVGPLAVAVVCVAGGFVAVGDGELELEPHAASGIASTRRSAGPDFRRALT